MAVDLLPQQTASEHHPVELKLPIADEKGQHLQALSLYGSLLVARVSLQQHHLLRLREAFGFDATEVYAGVYRAAIRTRSVPSDLVETWWLLTIYQIIHALAEDTIGDNLNIRRLRQVVLDDRLELKRF